MSNVILVPYFRICNKRPAHTNYCPIKRGHEIAGWFTCTSAKGAAIKIMVKVHQVQVLSASHYARTTKFIGL